MRLFAPAALPCALAFTLRVLPQARPDPHVLRLHDFLLAAVGRGTEA